MASVNLSLTQSLGLATRQFLEQAEANNDPFQKHVVGRFRLLGTALVGTTETISRLVFFLIGQIAGIFTLYRSDEINAFLKDQIKFGFAATVITSASFFSILSPSVFTSLELPHEALPHQEEGAAAPAPQREEAPAPIHPPQPVQRQREVSGIAQMVEDIVRLPFQMLALTFQIPFYCIYMSFELMVLPLRLMLLPLQILCSPFTRLSSHRNNPLRLDLL